MSRMIGFAIAAVVALAAAPVAAQTKLKVADSFPSGHYVSVHAAKKFMDEATRLSGGKLQFDYFPTEQLGKAKDMLQLTVSGVTDIAYIAPSYVADKLPLSAVGELPGMFGSACEGTAAIWRLAKDGVLNQKEFAPNGLKPLMAFALAPYQISTRNAPIAKLDDLKGLKIRAAGGAMDLTLRTLGAVPVRLAAPEIRESLMRGTVDGSVGPHGSAKPYDLHTAFKHSTAGASFGGFVFTYSISLKKWNELAPDLQKALAAAGDATTKSFCAVADTQEEAALKEMEQSGLKAWRLSASERDDLAKRLAPVHDDWAKRLEDRKLAGNDVLQAFLAARTAK